MAGLVASAASPLSASTHSPPMNSRVTVAAVAMAKIYQPGGWLVDGALRGCGPGPFGNWWGIVPENGTNPHHFAGTHPQCRSWPEQAWHASGDSAASGG